jgi:hypothetical protein
MANYRLTEAMIQISFEKTGIDEKYYPIYAKIAKRYFEDLSKEGSNEEEQTEEDYYAISSLNLADEYITYYAKEAEKGHCEQWCDTIAEKGEADYWAYRDAYDFIEDEEEKEKKLLIHAKSLSEDPVFVERYIYLFKEPEENSFEMAKEYTKAFHKCIDNGKSQNYANGYAYAVSENNYLDDFCKIFAEAYDLAKQHDKNDDEAISFGELCTDVLDQGIYSFLKKEHLKKYHEDWQLEFYYKKICEEEEQDRNRALAQDERNEIREEIRWHMTQIRKEE